MQDGSAIPLLDRRPDTRNRRLRRQPAAPVRQNFGLDTERQRGRFVDTERWRTMPVLLLARADCDSPAPAQGAACGQFLPSSPTTDRPARKSISPPDRNSFLILGPVPVKHLRIAGLPAATGCASRGVA